MIKQKNNIWLKVIILLIAFGTFSYYQLNTANISYLNDLYIIYWLILGAVSYLTIGYNKNRNILKKDVIQIIIIYTLFYLLISYLLGIYTGFAATPISLKLISIIKNILPVIILILTQEFVRYILVKKCNNNRKYLFLITLLFIINEIVVYYFLYNLNNYSEFFEFFGVSIIGTIFNNILYTYITYYTGEIPNIYYRIIMEGYVYFVPFIPDLGIYLNTVFHIILPVIIIIHLSHLFEKEEEKYVKNKYYKAYYAIIVVFIGVIVSLTSGLFRFQLLAIASDSMNPTFRRGDAVLIDKSKDYDLDIDDIVAFKKDNKIVVHRIIKIKKIKNQYYYTTKGDNNSNDDENEITKEDIVGKLNYVVPYVGYPTVWLSEIIS